ncbi:MAG: hypothetical protein AB8H79_05120 [Myxococcota bacterium]
MSDSELPPQLPPPRWKASGTVDPFVRNLMLVGVGIAGMLAGCTCLWAGCLHSTVEDVMKMERNNAPSGQVDRFGREPDRIVRDPNNEIVPGLPPRLKVRRGLIQPDDPEVAPRADDGTAPDSRNPDQTPRKSSAPRGPSESEMFGVD